VRACVCVCVCVFKNVNMYIVWLSLTIYHYNDSSNCQRLNQHKVSEEVSPKTGSTLPGP